MRTRLVGLLALTLLGAVGCAEEADPVPRVTQPTEQTTQPTPGGPGTGSSEGSGTPDPAGPPSATSLVEGLEVPWGVAFLPDGAAVVTERMSGRVLHVTADGEVSEVGVIADSNPQGEGGLLGVAASPNYDDDRTLFFYTTTESDNRVVRAVLDGKSLGEPSVVLDEIPKGGVHDGGRIAFGPDGFLYVTTGEIAQPDLAQDPNSLAGKILRITPDGDPAPGNPDAGSPVWSLGHRNVQGLAWDDEGRLWASEFGSSEFDELNLIQKGGNYGWPAVEGAGGGAEFVDPQLVWPTHEASPSGLAYADGHLWMAGLRGQRLWRIWVDAGGTASQPTAFFTEEYGRLRTVATAPDGTLWLTTSNRDDRGTPTPEDDRILVVEP